ncbi:MAG TPA: amidase family protein [Mycobacteriales bacterium]|nr:amidase family protein [Mycobacteriales bacterium]
MTRPRRVAFGRRRYAVVGLLMLVPLPLLGAAPVGAGGGDDETRIVAAVVDPVLRGVRLDRATVLDLQQAMRRRRLTSSALTNFYLARIRALNPRLHAVIETNPDARREAAASDRRRRARGARTVLEGVPVLVKDTIDTADRQQTTAGSLALVGSRPARDAGLVRRLRAGGAVILGKANLSEWANFRSTRASSGWSARGGQTNNPYVLDHNPCGSSSGSAVAAAASLAAVTIGTETDGSIMCPAGRSGVVGLKPTLGLVSRSGMIPVSIRQDTAGPVTRTVTDAAAVLSMIQGVDSADPATAAAGSRARREYLDDLDRRALRGKRIGVWRGGGQNPAVTAVLQRSIATLRARGLSSSTMSGWSGWTWWTPTRVRRCGRSSSTASTPTWRPGRVDTPGISPG